VGFLVYDVRLTRYFYMHVLQNIFQSGRVCLIKHFKHKFFLNRYCRDFIKDHIFIYLILLTFIINHYINKYDTCSMFILINIFFKNRVHLLKYDTLCNENCITNST